MKNVPVSVCPLPHFEGLSLPAYETTGSAGMDVRAAVPENDPMVLMPGARTIILINLGDAPFTIARGERIAQLVLAPVTQLGWKEVDSLDETSRGDGGFGSTGR